MARQKVEKTEETKKVKSSKKSLYDTVSVKDLGLEGTQPVISEVSFSSGIRALMQNWRQGTVGCKDRSEVAFSNKKPWKQKGTGRARAGSARSPLWRKGGVVFGPQPRIKTLHVSKKLKRNVLGALAFNFIENGRVACLDWSLEGDKPRTAAAYQILHTANLTNNKLTVFIPMDDMLTYASFINIPNVRLLFYDQANAYDLAHSDCLVVFKKDLNQFKEMVGRWI